MFFKVITTIAITVFILAAQTTDLSTRKSDGMAIPLTKRSDTEARKFHTTSHNAKIIRGMDGSERDTGTPHFSAVKRDVSGGAGLGLTKYVNGIWYGTISIGTPPKSFTVQLNTGTSAFFVPASTGDENCRSHHNLWDPASSQTNVPFNEDLEIHFTDGRSVTGKQYMDNVTIAGFTADIQIIGAATTYSSGMGASDFAPDGILGLAFPSFSESGFYVKSPLLHTLFDEGQLSQPVFSLKFTASGGELYIGGTNRALYVQNTLVYTPVTNPVLWQLKIDSIKVNDKIILKDVPAIIDTGANYIYGDPPGVYAVHRAVRGAPFDASGFYTYPCRLFPTVTLIIGGRPFSLPPAVLNLGRVELRSANCFSGIVNGNVDSWSIGALFLQKFYTVYDFNSESPRIGFAELRGGSY